MKKEELLQSAKPILFNTEMVRAILDGRKTVTRRLVKPQPKFRLCYTFAGCNHGTRSYPCNTAHEFWGEEYRLPDYITDEDKQMVWKPPCHTDDVLYVRETWERFDCCSCEGDEHGNCPKEPKKSVLDKYGCGCYMYRATDEINGDAKWHPSIHMPKGAARIWLNVTDVRVERLQGMDWRDALDEGVNTQFSRTETGEYIFDENPIDDFIDLWNSTIKKSDIDTYGWDANPWVWVIEFERIISD